MVTFSTNDCQLFNRRQNSYVTHFWSWSERRKLQYNTSFNTTFFLNLYLIFLCILANIEANALIQGNTIQLNGKNHFNVQDVSIDFQIGHASIYLSNLFEGDNELGNKLINLHTYIIS